MTFSPLEFDKYMYEYKSIIKKSFAGAE